MIPILPRLLRPAALRAGLLLAATLAFASLASAQPLFTRLLLDYTSLYSNTGVPLTLSADGTLYGASNAGIYRLKTDGTGFTFIVDQSSLINGVQSYARIKFGVDGRLYIAQPAGFCSFNPDGSGLMTSASNLLNDNSAVLIDTVVVNRIVADIVPATNGRIYGLDVEGYLFSANPDGTGFTILHQFATWGETMNGEQPFNLIQGADGRLYGLTSFVANDPLGTSTDAGSIFRVNLDGTGFTTLHIFTAAEGNFPGGGNGLTQAADGTLYGATWANGALGGGALYKIKPDGTGFAIVHSFDPNQEGHNSNTLITIGVDGRLYCTTTDGARFYSLLPDGSDFRVEFDTRLMGDNSVNGVVMSANRVLYGATQSTIYSLDVSGRPFVHLNIGDMAGPLPEVNYGQVGQPFSYQITASNNPTSYTASGLPAGLTLNPSTGLISGTPLRSGAYLDVYFTATNAVGTSPLTPYLAMVSPMTWPRDPGSAVRFVINPPEVPLAATVTLGTLTATYDSTAKQATATTNPAGLAVVLTYNGAPDLPVALGSYVVVATIDDPDYAGSATGTLTIAAANTGPTLTLPANLAVEATGKNGANVSFAASAVDAVTGQPLHVKYSKQPGSKFPLGVTTVTVTAKDAAGKTSSGTFTVTVRDTTAPTLKLPSNRTVKAEKSSGVKVEFEPKASDLVDERVRLTSSPASGSLFPLGTTTVVVTATDDAGNRTSGSFTVTVVKVQKDKDGKDCDDDNDHDKDRDKDRDKDHDRDDDKKDGKRG